MLDRERTEVRRNGEWLDMPMEDLLRLVRRVTLARVTRARRLLSSGSRQSRPISLLELLYPVLQGYDSVAVRRRRRARGHRPEVQPAARSRRPAGLRPGAAGDPDDADPARASTASAG